MPQTCPACGSELQTPDEQRYCHSCGGAVNVEVDRERIRREASGFLDESDAKVIAAIIDGDSDRGGHEYNHIRAQEEVRLALRDFALLALWEEFDAHTALTDTEDWEFGGDPPISEGFNHLVRTFQFFMQGLSLPAIGAFFEFALREEMHTEGDDNDVDLPDVEILVEGEPVAELYDEL